MPEMSSALPHTIEFSSRVSPKVAKKRPVPLSVIVQCRSVPKMLETPRPSLPATMQWSRLPPCMFTTAPAPDAPVIVKPIRRTLSA